MDAVGSRSRDRRSARVANHLNASSLAGGKLLLGYYSFVEDFRRNRVSTTTVRKAHFGNGWIQTADGKWRAITEARFTADSNPVMNINADRDGSRYFLATGGDTKNTGVKLQSKLEIKPEDSPPKELPGDKAIR